MTEVQRATGIIWAMSPTTHPRLAAAPYGTTLAVAAAAAAAASPPPTIHVLPLLRPLAGILRRVPPQLRGLRSAAPRLRRLVPGDALHNEAVLFRYAPLAEDLLL